MRAHHSCPYFLTEKERKGSFPSFSFLVTCDSETNKAESRPIDASSESPRVTQSYPESFGHSRVTKSHAEPSKGQ